MPPANRENRNAACCGANPEELIPDVLDAGGHKELWMNLAMRYGWLLCLSLASLAGCFESKQIITLNPDGSGRTEFDTVTVIVPLPPEIDEGAAGDDDKTKPAAATQSAQAGSQTACRRHLEGVINADCHVEAWANLNYEAVRADRCRLTGTVYYANVFVADLLGIGQFKTTWLKDGNSMLLTVELGEDRPASKPAEPEISPERAAEILAERRREHASNAASRARFLSRILIDATYILPGKLEQVDIFEKTERGGVRLVITGKMMLDTMDRIMADEALMLACIKQGKDPMKDSAVLLEKMFGKKGPIQARVGGELAPLFDYKAEVEKAKADAPAMYKALGISPPPARPAQTQPAAQSPSGDAPATTPAAGP
jgi:hypothetical protein